MFSTYQELGGITGTLDKRATEIYNSFDTDQQRTVQHIFQQLTQLGEGTEDTRRRVFLDNLISEPLHPTGRVRAVIDTLSSKDNRLLVTSEVTGKGEAKERRAIVDVAHEALIRHWRLLRQWIEKNRDLLRQQRRIEASAVTWQDHGQSKGYLLQGFPLKEARRFQKQQSDTFPLSDYARIFLKKSTWRQNWNYLKPASVVVLLPLIFDYSLHRQNVEQYYTRLNGASRDAERDSVIFLTQHCSQQGGKLTGYLTERTTGQYCRSLINRRFNGEANLDRANLDSANLVRANLYSANLYSANLNNATFIATDLRTTKGLTQKQLEGEYPPFICNAPLPENIEIEGGKDRDCDKLADILYQRYPNGFRSLEAAEQYVNQQRQKTWE